MPSNQLGLLQYKWYRDLTKEKHSQSFADIKKVNEIILSEQNGRALHASKSNIIEKTLGIHLNIS